MEGCLRLDLRRSTRLDNLREVFRRVQYCSHRAGFHAKRVCLVMNSIITATLPNARSARRPQATLDRTAVRNIGPIPNCMRKYSNTFDTYPVSRDRQARRPFITCLSRSQCGLDCCPCCMFGTLRQLAVWYRLTILQHCYSVGNRHGKRYSMRTDMLRSFVEGMQSCIVHESPGRLGQPTAGLCKHQSHYSVLKLTLY